MIAGELTVIVGGMFSGKSTELQRQGKRRKLAGHKVAFFKPYIDNRYAQESVSTHDGNDVEAIVVVYSKEIEDTSQQLGLDVVLIDEIQFFENDIIAIIENLLRKGIDVICSGLDVDRWGTPFGVVPYLMATAENVTKLKAVCSGCGEDAWVSAGKFDSEEQNVVGEKDLYEPLCRTCFYQKGGII